MEKEKKKLEHVTQLHPMPSEVKETLRLQATLQNHACFKVFKEAANIIHKI